MKFVFLEQIIGYLILWKVSIHFLLESEMPNQGYRDRKYCFPGNHSWPDGTVQWMVQVSVFRESWGTSQQSAKLCPCLRAGPLLGNWKLISVFSTASINILIFSQIIVYMSLVLTIWMSFWNIWFLGGNEMLTEVILLSPGSVRILTRWCSVCSTMIPGRLGLLEIASFVGLKW